MGAPVVLASSLLLSMGPVTHLLYCDLVASALRIFDYLVGNGNPLQLATTTSRSMRIRMASRQEHQV